MAKKQAAPKRSKRQSSKSKTVGKRKKPGTVNERARKRGTSTVITSRKSSGSAPAQKTTAPQPHNISVRMYRGLLGDFFLIRHKYKGRIFKMLIDCGVLQRIGSAAAKPSTSRGKARIITNVADFIDVTGGHIDLAVATHEHYDHLSGFILASEAFQKFKIDKLWLAWTEDRKDKLANSYRTKRISALGALAALTENTSLRADSEELQLAANLLQFYGGARNIRAQTKQPAKAPKKLPANASCEAVMMWLQSRAGSGNVSFLKPGDVVQWGVGGIFRAHVLGPPRDDEMLRKRNPSKQNSEVYLTKNQDVEIVLGLAGMHGKHGGKTDPDSQPFTSLHRRPYNPGKDGKARGRAELFKDPIVKLYRSRDSVNRSIGSQWLSGAEQLALKIDGDVNNTSLALALELADKRILLFPGDAQVGNWLSWANQEYPADAPKKDQLTIEQIFEKTILYKVGHHASHNATMRERGLELMTNPSLCAMIPVVEETAREQKTTRSPDGWAMPYGELYKRLDERTNERVVRGDKRRKGEAEIFKKSIFELSYGPNFKETQDPLWVELLLPL